MIKPVLISGMIASACMTQAQIRAWHVIAPAGIYATAARGSISSTVAEMTMVSTLTNNSGTLTQGFQQTGKMVAADVSAMSASTTALPIKLLNFEGHRNGSYNELHWTTATEIDNWGFDVERRSAAGYVTIGEVRGRGNSSSMSNYQFIDQHPESGVNYYRLKQVDLDGRFEYSAIIAVSGGDATEDATAFSLFPLPATDQINLMAECPKAQSVEVLITDMLGESVIHRTYSLEAGYNLQPIDVKQLAQGQYTAQIRFDNQSKVIRFSKS
ncbi:MAG: T9SS type A sorting domain-containing protein [Chitinophagales bacterium]